MNKLGSQVENIIGKPTADISAMEKVTGRAKYTDDLPLKNPLYVKILRSPHASAELISVDVSAAQKLSGVMAIITGEDFENKFGVLPISRDEPPLAKSQIRYVGEPVAAVAAESEKTAELALRKIIINCKLKTPCLDPSLALKKTSDPIHPELGKESNLHKSVELKFGDLEEGFEAAEVILEGEFTFPSVTHAFTEPHATQVEINSEKEICVYSSTQVPHYLHRALSEVLEIPLQNIRVVKPYLGGGFGGKSDPFPHEIIAAKLALLTGRNTRLTLEREDVFFSHHGRHGTKIKMKMGVHSQQGITALENKALIDGGAYGSFGVVTSYYNGVLLQGPYPLKNYHFHTDRVYTNKPMCGAMRGHGGVNPRFASEVLLDMACEKMNVDPCEFRLKNFLSENTITENEFRVTSNGIRNGLKNAMEKSRWNEKFKRLPYGKGIGVAAGFFISGSALPIHWNEWPQSTVRLTLDFDGAVTLYSGASDIGQGSDTVLAMMVSEVLGLPINNIKVISADTRLCPIDLGSYSSRVTFMAGNAARNAAIRMRKILVKAACEISESPLPNYEKTQEVSNFFRQGGRNPNFESSYLGANPDYNDGFNFINQKVILPNGEDIDFTKVVSKALNHTGALQTKGIYLSPKLGGKYKGAGAGLSPSYSFSTFISEVSVDTDTGFLKVDRVTCAHDCGRPLNPLAVEGQLEGSIHMGLGQALMEKVDYHNGATQNAGFLDYKIPSPFEMPEVSIVSAYSDESEGPFGAKEVGEGSLAPFIPSIANALYDAVGIRIFDQPLTPEKILGAMNNAST